jgi:hypothetical protein
MADLAKRTPAGNAAALKIINEGASDQAWAAARKAIFELKDSLQERRLAIQSDAEKDRRSSTIALAITLILALAVATGSRSGSPARWSVRSPPSSPRCVALPTATSPSAPRFPARTS